MPYAATGHLLPVPSPILHSTNLAFLHSNMMAPDRLYVDPVMTYIRYYTRYGIYTVHVCVHAACLGFSRPSQVLVIGTTYLNRSYTGQGSRAAVEYLLVAAFPFPPIVPIFVPVFQPLQDLLKPICIHRHGLALVETRTTSRFPSAQTSLLNITS